MRQLRPKIEAIKPLQRIVELDDGTTVPITRNPGGRSRNAVPLPDAKQFPKGTKRALTEIRVSQAITIQPETQTFVTVNKYQAVLIAVEPQKENIR